jgi:gamma-glutamylcyclotransferase (GGCT)/AIG2-like uncharacterized protein YtfP
MKGSSVQHMFLNGTAMSGQKDHGVIAGLARFIRPATTAPNYRFFAIRDEFPGLFSVNADGAAIAGELYEMSDELLFDVLLPQEPGELEIGSIDLADGSTVRAMILQPERIRPGDKVIDIADFGGWRAYQNHLAANSAAGTLLGLSSAGRR